MQIGWRRGIAALLAAIFLLCVLALWIPVDDSGPDALLRPKRTAVRIMTQLTPAASAVVSLPAGVNSKVPISAGARLAPSPVILELNCVQLC